MTPAKFAFRRSIRRVRRTSRVVFLEPLEDRIVPVFPVTDVPFAFSPLVDGMSSACEHLEFPATIDILMYIGQRDGEGWAWVNPGAKDHPELRYRDVTGVVRDTVQGSRVTHVDFPATHDSHDQNTHVQVDFDDPLNSGLISVVNEPSGRVEISGFEMPDEIEVEWETGIGTEEKSGDGTAGRLPGGGAGPIFPKWAWPNPGDRIWVNGHHVYDCGHTTTEFEGDDLALFNPPGEVEHFFRSEIHPPRAMASMRDQVMALADSGGVPIRVTATDLYIHGDGGMVTDVLNCGTGYMDGGPGNFRCRPPFVDSPPDGDRTPIDVNFEFDIHLPAKPFDAAVLAVDDVADPSSTITDPAFDPMLTPFLDHLDGHGRADPILHVLIPLAGSGAQPFDVYARHINAGWVAEVPRLRHMQLTLTKMDMHHDGDDPEDGGGDASFFWLNVNKSPNNEWERLADFNVPTPTSVGFFVPTGFGTIDLECRSGFTNIMDEYYADDDGCAHGELNFAGPTFDFYLAPSEPLKIRAHGYDQDCYDGFFGDHEFHSLDYADCTVNPFATGLADNFHTLDAQLLVSGTEIAVTLFREDDPPLTFTLTSGTELPADFRIEGLKLPTHDYDLYFTLEGFALTPEETNDPPVVEANGPYTVNEGSSVPLSSAGSGDPDGTIVSYEWDVDYDGSTFDVDATGASPTFSAALLDGPASRTVALRVTDNFGASAIDTATVMVLNAPPTADVTGDTVGVAGQTRSFVLSATDPSTADTAAGFTFNVDFGDGTTLLLGPGAPLTITHVYTIEADYTVQVTATDKDGGVSAVASHVIHIQPAVIEPDPTHPGATELAVGGTAGDDHIIISPVGSTGAVRVRRNGTDLGDFNPTGRIVVYAGDGDDDVQVAGGVTLEAWLYGGNGNDRLKGGGGFNVLLGEAGDDLLIGGSSQDVMIGGTGADRIVGNASDDLLVAGITAFDANDAALAAILAEWTSARDYATRIATLQGTGSGPRLNGDFFLLTDGPAATVSDDGAADTLTGSAGRDWFFANLDSGVKDKITDLGGSEFANDLDLIFSP